MRAASEPSLACAQAQSGVRTAACSCPSRDDQPRAHRGQAMPRIELIERSAQHLVPARPARHALADMRCRSAAANSDT